jgi:hypothetical protein
MGKLERQIAAFDDETLLRRVATIARLSIPDNSFRKDAKRYVKVRNGGHMSKKRFNAGLKELTAALRAEMKKRGLA